MKMSMVLWVAVLMAAAGFRADAQTTASPTPRPTPPSGPLLDNAPDFSAWIITRYTISGRGSQPADAAVGSASAPSKPDSSTSSKPDSSTIVTKTGAIRHRMRKLKSGEQEDVWYEHGNRITMQSIWKIPMFEGVSSGANLPQGPDFPELAWISANNFVGTQEYQGTSYLVFEMQVTDGNERLAKEYGYKLNSTLNRAYINADTRLPWLLQTGNILQRYAFQTPPTAMIDVPAEYQRMFDTYEKKKSEPARRPVAP